MAKLSLLDLYDLRVRQTARCLNTLLADEYILYTKNRCAHWKMLGENYHDLNSFFESQYDSIDGIIDEVAGRVTAFGDYGMASLKDFLSITRLVSRPGVAKEQPIAGLLNDHQAIIHGLENDITQLTEYFEDYQTAEFMLSVKDKHERAVWLLRCYV